jgi:hypothetical protein
MTDVATSEVARNYALVLAAVFGVAVAIWRAIAADRQARAQAMQVEQARREHVAKLLADATERLDHEKLHMRLGAILSMRSVVEAYPDLSGEAVDLLTAYLADLDYGDEDPPADVAEIMRLVIPRDVSGD